MPPLEFVPSLLPFYSTLYLDEKSSKLFWMTEDEVYSVSLVRFTAILGLQDHTHYPKKLHDDRVMELNQMRFMYENDDYKLSKVEGFKPFFVLHRLLRKNLPPREGDSSRVSQYERNILHAINKEERFNVFNFIFQEIWNVAVSNNRSCAYAPYIMKIIEQVSNKTFVNNIEHTKLWSNKDFTSIKPEARTRIPPPDAPNNYRGSGPCLLKMLRGIFTACTTSKEVIIKRQADILRNQHIIHHNLEITEPLEKFDETETELVDPYKPLTAKELAYFQMGEAHSHSY
jgi:hypothetical protein